MLSSEKRMLQVMPKIMAICKEVKEASAAAAKPPKVEKKPAAEQPDRTAKSRSTRPRVFESVKKFAGLNGSANFTG